MSQRLGMLASTENGADLRVLSELIESGQVTPAMDRTYPLTEVPAALRRMSDNAVHGKIAIALFMGISRSRYDPHQGDERVERTARMVGARRPGPLAVAGVVIGFSLSSTLAKRAETTGVLLAFWRLTVATVVFLYLWSTGRRVTMRHGRRIPEGSR